MRQIAPLVPDPGAFPDAHSLGTEPSPSPAHCLAALLEGDPERTLRRAHAILGQCSLSDLLQRPAEDLAEQFSLALTEAVRLEAALVLTTQVRMARKPRRPEMKSANQVYSYLGGRLANLQRETLQALLLDAKHRLQRVATISIGTLTSSQVHPREVLRPAIRHAAAALILVHNHPSGDPDPSLEDIKVTRRILEASALLGIPLLDHVIIGHGKYVSLRERACLPWR